jgi:hypothetical protein
MPKQKKKSASSSSSIDYKKLTLDQLTSLHDADDESINEDEAFNSDDEELYGKYFQANSDDDDDDDDVSSDVRSKSYLGLTVPLFANDDDDDDDTNEEGIVTTAIKKGHKMSLSSLCLDIPSCNFQQIKLMVRCVYLGDMDEPWLCLGNFLGSSVPPSVPVSLEVVGPCRVEWKVEGKYSDTLANKKGGSGINIFGKIVPIFEEAFSDDDISVDYADAFMSEDDDEEEDYDDEEEEGTFSAASLEENADEEDAKSSKKRKLSIDNDASEGEDEATAKLGNNGKLTKKERKRLAQKKAQQLEETLSAARNDGEDTNGKTSKKKKKKKKKNSTEETTNETEELSKPTSLTRERRLPSGVTVRDLLSLTMEKYLTRIIVSSIHWYSDRVLVR